QFVTRHRVGFSAVRSSSTAEDLEGASFAGLQETYLNVTGIEAILEAVKRCWSSLFTTRVLVYRARKGFDPKDALLAVLVQKMVDSVVSGILFTRDPNTGENHMIVEAGWGLGEAIVGGEVTPDHYVVDGATLKVVHKQISEQRIRLVRAPEGGNRREDVPADAQKVQKLSDHRLARLVSLARVIESHYRRPMDIEWCADAESLYIVQARPVTTIPTSTAPGAARTAPEAEPEETEPATIVRGFGASPASSGGSPGSCSAPARWSASSPAKCWSRP
ncbi:phosphoenolpyruvate synthase, partial [mine drainage metagenome]